MALAAALLSVSATLPRAIGNSFWEDEVASGEIIVEPTPFHVALEVTRGESTPPVWYEVAWLFHALGVPVEEVRLLSVALAAIAAAAVVIYAGTVVRPWAAGLAGILVALGSQFVGHGGELRSYSLLVLLTVALASSLETAAREPRRNRLVVLAAVVALGALTHYFFLFSLLASFIWLWTSSELRPVRRRLTATMSVGLLPFLAWLPAFAVQYRHQRFAWIGPFEIHDVFRLYFSLFAGAASSAGWVAEGAVLALVIIGTILLWRGSARGRHCALLAVLPVFAASAFWLMGAQIFLPRNLLAVGPFAAIAIAAAVGGHPVRVALPVTALFAAGFIVLSVERGPSAPADYRGMAQALVDEGWEPSDPIILVGPLYATRDPLRWYLPGHPDLRVGVPTAQQCPRTYLVERQPKPASGERALETGDTRVVGRFLVKAMGSSTVAFPSSPARAYLLGALGGSPCLRLLPR
jgi:hypothetical protein